MTVDTRPHTTDPPGAEWTGPRTLDVLQGGSGPALALELEIGRLTVDVRHVTRLVAELDRAEFRNWLLQTAPAPLVRDDTVWSVQLGLVCVEVVHMGSAVGLWALAADSLRDLVAVI